MTMRGFGLDLRGSGQVLLADSVNTVVALGLLYSGESGDHLESSFSRGTRDGRILASISGGPEFKYRPGDSYPDW